MDNSTIEAKGACLCGAVTIATKTMSLRAGACHCSSCRRWSAGPFLNVDCGSEVIVEGDELAIYDSSDWAERGFCKKCGSSLFYRFKKSGKHMVSAALFGEVPELTMTHQVFVDQRPSYYEFSQETKMMTGPEVFALFGGNS
jgi:hypothetical protein